MDKAERGQTAPSSDLNPKADVADKNSCAAHDTQQARPAMPETPTPPTAQVHHPVDTGWAWVILSSVFIIQFVDAGIMRAFGVLFVAIQMTYGASASTIGVIGLVEAATFSITSFLSLSVLLDVGSARQVTLLGVLVGTAGFAASFLATGVAYLIVSFSALIGIAIGLTVCPGFVLLTLYFKEKLPLATATANTGGSIGGVVMPIAVRLMLDEYSLSGTFLLLAGVMAQVFVCASLLTPVSQYGPRSPRPPPESAELRKPDVVQSQTLLARQRRQARLTRRTVSESAAECLAVTHVSDVTLVTQSLQTLNGRHGCRRRPHSLSPGRSGENLNPLLVVSSVGGTSALSLATMTRDVHPTSPSQLPFTLDHANGASKVTDTDDDDVSLQPTLCGVVREKLTGVFHPAVVRRPVFWALAAYHYLACMVCGLSAAYLPALAQEKGLTVTEGALLLTISGALDIVSRLLPGVLAQAGLVKPHTSVATSLLVLGVLFQFTAWVEGMGLMTLMAVIYGLFAGVFFSMLPLILVEFSEAETFRHMFGMIQLALGLTGMTGFPIIGYLSDMSGSYVTSFYFMGACGLLSSLLMFCMPAIRRWEEKWRQSSCSINLDP